MEQRPPLRIINELHKPALATVFGHRDVPIVQTDVAEFRNMTGPQAVLLNADSLGRLRNSISSDVLEPFRASVQRNQTTLILDSSCEGPVCSTATLESVLKPLQLDSANSPKVVYVTQNRAAIRKINKAGIFFKDSTPIEGVDFNYFTRSLFRQVERILSRPTEHTRFNRKFFPYVNQKKERLYLSFNNRPAVHRLILIGWLIKNKYITDGWVSLIGSSAAYKDRFIRHARQSMKAQFPDFSEFFEIGVSFFDEEGPLRIELEEDDAVATAQLPLEPFSKSYFSIVTESEMSGGDIERYTEKSVKALLCGHPVVILGNPFTLRTLKQLGFITFSDFWDESYDQVLDPADRLHKALGVIDQLLSMNESEFRQIMVDAWPLVEHNIRNAAGLGRNRYIEMEDKILQSIRPGVV